MICFDCNYFQYIVCKSIEVSLMDQSNKKFTIFTQCLFLPQKLSQYCTTKTNTIQTLLNRGKSPFTPKLEIIFWKSFEFTKNYNDFNFIFFWKPSTVAAASGAGVGRSPSASKTQGFIHPGSAIWNKKVKKNVSFSFTKKKKLEPQKFPFQQPAPERHRLYQNWWVRKQCLDVNISKKLVWPS